MSRIAVRRRLQSQSKQRRVANKDMCPAARTPRIAKLMALAICFDELIRDGLVADQAELSRLGKVTRARITQIMKLVNLAPEIQEHILFAGVWGRRAVAERTLRPISGVYDRNAQRDAWEAVAGPLLTSEEVAIET